MVHVGVRERVRLSLSLCVRVACCVLRVACCVLRVERL